MKNTRVFFILAAVVLLFAFGLSKIAEAQGVAAAFAVLLAVQALPYTFGNVSVLGYRPPIQLPSMQNAAPSQTGTINIPVGPTYDAIGIRILADGVLVPLSSLATNVSEIRLVADTGVFRRITPALLLSYLQDRNLSAALTNGAGTNIYSVVIPFSDPSRRTVEGEEATALGTVGVKQVLLEVDFTSAAVAYTVQGLAMQRNIAKRFGFLETWNVETLTIVNGVANFQTLSTADDYLGILFQSTAITRVRIMRSLNSVQSIDFDCYWNDAIMARRLNGLGAADANFFPATFDYDRQLTSVLPMAIRDNAGKVVARVSDFNIEVTASAGATIKALRRNLWLG